MISYFLMMLLVISSLGENCDDMLCAHVLDPVCGMAETHDGIQIIMKYKNICYMRKKACELDYLVEITQVADEFCNIKKGSRRVFDFSIVGAHQACNHSCPTYCIDTYQPACAQIWKSSMVSYTYRTMVNHCHIDLFSCATGANVTVQPLAKCYKNPSSLMFMQHVASLKSLSLLDEEPSMSRRTNDESPLKLDDSETEGDEQEEKLLREYLPVVVRRLFEKIVADTNRNI